jgi:hypothetical protein
MFLHPNQSRGERHPRAFKSEKSSSPFKTAIELRLRRMMEGRLAK